MLTYYNGSSLFLSRLLNKNKRKKRFSIAGSFSILINLSWMIFERISFWRLERNVSVMHTVIIFITLQLDSFLLRLVMSVGKVVFFFSFLLCLSFCRCFTSWEREMIIRSERQQQRRKWLFTIFSSWISLERLAFPYSFPLFLPSVDTIHRQTSAEQEEKKTKKKKMKKKDRIVM